MIIANVLYLSLSIYIYIEREIWSDLRHTVI